jgi:hypothetical protein
MPDVKILKKKSYLAMVRNAAQGEVRMFRNLFALVDGEEKDILRDGQVSCAVFVSAILYLQNSGWISSPHATVPSTEKDMEQNGWIQIPDLREGAVVTWEPITYHDGATHWHVGFYVGNDRAVSNASNDSGIPKEHHITYDGTRQVARIWWHPVLDGE